MKELTEEGQYMLETRLEERMAFVLVVPLLEKLGYSWKIENTPEFSSESATLFYSKKTEL